jgi:hypothetical protein
MIMERARRARRGHTGDMRIKADIPDDSTARGLWYAVATTHEGSGGKFSFTIKAAATGTYHYRAVVHDLAGYVMYGYSPARSLRVTS